MMSFSYVLFQDALCAVSVQPNLVAFLLSCAGAAKALSMPIKPPFGNVLG